MQHIGWQMMVRVVLASGVISPARNAATLPPRIVLDTGITTDTGDFAPRPRVYANYTTPRACITAAANARNFAQRVRAVHLLQSARFTRPEHDTLPSAAIAVARACGARFTLGATTQSDLPDLFTLALWEQNDTLAQTVLSNLLAQAKTSAVQRVQFVWAIHQYLDATPARVVAAEALAAQADALGASAWDTQVAMQQALVDFGREYAEWPIVARHGEQLLGLIRNHRTEMWLPTLWETYQSLLTTAWLDQPDSLTAVTTRLRTEFSQPEMQQALESTCSGSQATHLSLCLTLEDAAHLRNAPSLSLPITDSTSLTTLQAVMLGIEMPVPQILPPLRADYWFPPPAGTVGGDSLHPAVQGRVTLIYHMDDKWCWQGCPQATDQLQALLARYGNSLAVTIIMDAAAGYTTLAEPASPAMVAQSYRWLFQTYLGLPVTVAVRIRPIESQLPPPDGRIRYAWSPPYHDLYSEGYAVLVTNRAGQAVYGSKSLLDNADNADRARLAKVVAHQEAER